MVAINSVELFVGVLSRRSCLRSHWLKPAGLDFSEAKLFPETHWHWLSAVLLLLLSEFTSVSLLWYWLWTVRLQVSFWTTSCVSPFYTITHSTVRSRHCVSSRLRATCQHIMAAPISDQFGVFSKQETTRRFTPPWKLLPRPNSMSLKWSKTAGRNILAESTA